MELPYYAVIFTSVLSENTKGYNKMALQMETLAKQQPGFLGMDSARNEKGITVSYWESLEAIQNWQTHSKHLVAQKLGKEQWYQNYQVKICKVEREYNYNNE